jgi:signal transduction histidine kinase
MDYKRRYTGLLEVARGLGVAGDMEKYLQSILSAATELTGSESAFILNYDETSKQLVFSIVPWFHRDALQGVKIPVDGTAEGDVYRKCRSLIIGDASSDVRHMRQIDRLAKFKTSSLMAVPMIFQGTPSGVFEVRNKAEHGHYTEDDVATLEMLAALASMAMRNEWLERRMQGSNNEINELDRLKNEFIAITSHELRTRLGLILGHATFLREMLGKEYYEQLDAIIRNAARLKEIIENLSNVDNYRTGAARLRQRRVSIARVVEDVVASFQEMAKQKGVKIKKQLEKAELLVNGDGSKIAIALSNLVKNAITFTDKGGQVLVKAGLVQGYVQVSVIDNGVGIPARDMPRVFERFFQVESHLTRRHGGMGLGLSVAKVMVEMHGGRIWAESLEGKGSNFTFVLPLDTTPPGESSAEQPFIL